MSISEIIIKAVGVILAIGGLLLVLSGVGINIFGGPAIGNPVFAVIIGLILIGFGIWILRGGNITP